MSSGNAASASVRAEEREKRRSWALFVCGDRGDSSWAREKEEQAEEGEEAAAVGSSFALIGRCSSSAPRGRAIPPEQILRRSLLLFSRDIVLAQDNSLAARSETTTLKW